MDRPLKQAKLRQREFILEEYRKGCKSGKKLHEKLQQKFRGDPIVLSYAAISNWLARFRDGETDVSDRPRSGRPLGADDDRIRERIALDPYISVTDLYVDLNIPRRCVKSSIVREGLINNNTMWVPKVLPPALLDARIEYCKLMVETYAQDPFIDRVIFEGEKYITYNKYKQHFKTKNAKKILVPTEALIAKSGLKPHRIVLHLWWNCQGIIMYKLIGEHMLGKEFYLQELDELHSEMEERGIISNDLPLILYHNNDRYLDADVTAKVKGFGWEQMTHPRYSPDLSPTDYKVLRKFQFAFNTTLYTQLEEVEEFVFKYFDTRKTSFYQDAVEMWPEKWHRVIETEGDYIANNE